MSPIDNKELTHRPSRELRSVALTFGRRGWASVHESGKLKPMSLRPKRFPLIIMPAAFFKYSRLRQTKNALLLGSSGLAMAKINPDIN